MDGTNSIYAHDVIRQMYLLLICMVDMRHCDRTPDDVNVEGRKKKSRRLKMRNEILRWQKKKYCKNRRLIITASYQRDWKQIIINISSVDGERRYWISQKAREGATKTTEKTQATLITNCERHIITTECCFINVFCKIQNGRPRPTHAKPWRNYATLSAIGWKQMAKTFRRYTANFKTFWP